MSQITVRMPVIETDGTLVTLVVGAPEAEFGDEVNVVAAFDRKQFDRLYVAGVDSAPANTIASDVLEMFNLQSTDNLKDLLERRYGTGLPVDVPVTIYTFMTEPVENVELSESE